MFILFLSFRWLKRPQDFDLMALWPGWRSHFGTQKESLPCCGGFMCFMIFMWIYAYWCDIWILRWLGTITFQWIQTWVFRCQKKHEHYTIKPNARKRSQQNFLSDWEASGSMRSWWDPSKSKRSLSVCSMTAFKFKPAQCKIILLCIRSITYDLWRKRRKRSKPAWASGGWNGAAWASETCQ